MRRALRGARYLSARTEHIARFIIEDLPYRDYADTIDWYREVGTALDDAGRALLACNDRYYLMTALLGRNQGDGSMLHPWLFQRCREVEADPDGHLDLWARYHGKSSIGTHAGIIQEIACDPEITICILSATNKIAKPFLAQIQHELEANQLLKDTFPDVLWQHPRREAPLWSRDKGIVVKRRGNPKEATVEAHGLVDGMPIGKHYHLLDYDDLVTDRLVGNDAIVRKVTEKYQLSDNLGKASATRKWHFGTRYSFNDTYGWIIENSLMRVRKYPATDDGTKKGRPVLMTQARWDEVCRLQQRTVAAQMLLNPIADSTQTFRPEWFRPYRLRPALINVYILCDPSKGATQRSDRTAIAVIGVDMAGNFYLLDGFRHRMPLSERWQCIKSLYLKWSAEPGVQHVKVGYEIYGQQSDDEVMRDYMARDKVSFALHALNTPRQGRHSKADRIGRLEPDLRESRFFLPAVVHHHEFGGNVQHGAVAVGDALWSVWSEADAQADPDSPHNVGQIIYRPLQAPLREHRGLAAKGQGYRIVRAIRRRDEEGNIYDLTREFMNEALFFPLAPKDDLIDVVSRIYDIGFSRPVQHEASALEPRSFEDS